MSAPLVASSRADRVVLTGGTVVDPRTGARLPRHDVVIEHGSITTVVPSEGDRGDAEIVDVGGRHVVPGYNDMHAHPWTFRRPARSLELMVRHGVTGVRQMSGSAALLARRHELGSGLSPRLLGMPGAVLTPVNASSDADVVATIRQQHEQGADFIKAALVRREVFGAAQAEANRLGIPILGHLPRGVDVARVSADGIGSIEHLGPGIGLMACCTPDPSTLQERAAAKPEPSMPAVLGSPVLAPVLDAMVRRVVVHTLNRASEDDVELFDVVNREFDDRAAAALADRLAADGTWQVPTLIRSRAQIFCEDATHRDDPALRHIAPSTRRSWQKATARYAQLPEQRRRVFRATYATMLTLTRYLDDAGVPMLAGSDASGAVWVVPGPSLHRELDELAAAGLSPLRVLQTTTSDAARFLGREDTMGAVEPGHDADLVVLDRDPLESVEHLHGIAAVVRAGRVIGGDELRAIEDAIAADPFVT